MGDFYTLINHTKKTLDKLIENSYSYELFEEYLSAFNQLSEFISTNKDKLDMEQLLELKSSLYLLEDKYVETKKVLESVMIEKRQKILLLKKYDKIHNDSLINKES